MCTISGCLFKLAQEKGVVRSIDRPAMTIAVDLGRKATKTNKTSKKKIFFLLMQTIIYFH